MITAINDLPDNAALLRYCLPSLSVTADEAGFLVADVTGNAHVESSPQFTRGSLLSLSAAVERTTDEPKRSMRDWFQSRCFFIEGHVCV